jgi:hypothetical protein
VSVLHWHLYMHLNPYPPSLADHFKSLVDLSLGQAGDLLGTVLDLAVGGLEAAQNAGALLDGVVTSELVVGNAVQGAVAWKCKLELLNYLEDE